MFGKKKNRNQDNELLIRKLHGKQVKYVSKRDSVDYGEIIIGKNGVINIVEEQLVIICEGVIIFRHDIDKIRAAELLSMEGINIRYREDDNNDFETIVAYYKYHRK